MRTPTAGRTGQQIGLRRAVRRGWTLVEVCVTIALTALLLTIALRMIFLTDRAISRETAAAGTVGQAVRLAARLGEDARLACALMVQGPDRVALTMPDRSRVEYRRAGADTLRRAGDGQTAFIGVQADFAGSTPRLLRATLTDTTGARVAFAAHPRNLWGGGAL